MKGQFFVMATVIMIYTLMTMIQYIYDFSDINLVQLKTVTEFDYIRYVKDTLDTTVMSSFLPGKDYEKVESDIISTIIFLKSKMIERGISLTVRCDLIVDCYPNLNVSFNFSIKTSNLYTVTEFTSSYNPATCGAAYNCNVPADCAGLSHVLCLGHWECRSGHCSWVCGLQ